MTPEQKDRKARIEDFITAVCRRQRQALLLFALLALAYLALRAALPTPAEIAAPPASVLGVVVSHAPLVVMATMASLVLLMQQLIIRTARGWLAELPADQAKDRSI
ncbi:hypothetical protein [Thioalkalivibrio thiocyanodenitrificans]|uniref:hypothetical protein n=1 Tax=Thioalkalivibrio thiocyanodenitrificans TaxID=243063 RepID=UPI00037BDCAD|nr:hypothetical protein [Thioalkalivibrio thiocyanodenitrificans]